MIIGAVAFGVNSVLLVLWPNRFAEYIGVIAKYQSTEIEQWVFQLLGIVLLALSVHMSATSRHAPDPVFQRAALCMIFISAGLSYFTFIAPGEMTTGRWVFIAIGALFALLYVVTLPIKSIGIQNTTVTSD